jgi:2-aminoadipate transaminase
MATCGLISRHLLPSALALLRPAFTWVSFSKILAPGLRLGFAVAPPALFPKLLQAKQAVDLHTPIFNQRVAYEVLTSGIMDQHVQAIRILYKQQRDAMLTALETHMPEGVRWNKPDGGMFLWLQVPDSICTELLRAQAIEKGMAFVPGAAFHCGDAPRNTLRLSFVTASVEQIHSAIATLAELLRKN